MENISPNVRTVEEIYQKKTQLEHILLRPDTYIGSIETETDVRWLYDPSSSSLQLRRCSYTPGLFKIFDEILVNAADNKQRDPSMTTLRVSFHPTTHCITVRNDGRGIPIQLHREHGVYVPELIFGHLLTSSNYDDSDKKTVGGRNGYGAKLANIFSSHFTLTTHDGKQGKTYTQRWHHNMASKEEPVITPNKATKDYTEVSFTPDYARFGCEGLSPDMLHLMMRRVWDVAGTSDGKLAVYLNDSLIKCPSFAHYVSMFAPPPSSTPPPPPPVYDRPHPRWELCVGVSDGHFTHMSWVNSIATTRGGSHVTYITDQLVKALTEAIEKKHKKLKVKPAHVKAHLSLHLNCLIDNPAFDTQTKECLTTKRPAFGSSPDLSPAFLKAVATKTGLIDAIVSFASYKETEGLKRGDGKGRSARITGIPKLDDANDAGTKHGHLCTLILTEGDSAKALAVSGLSVVGRDRYGVFPLRGKLLNVREASAKQVMDNAEVTALKKILGLQQGRSYTTADTLRYGHIMIMTDQDHDGSHIKGLILNLFATFWPSLLRLPGFLTEFITPIVKARHTRTKAERAFYTLPEFTAWRAALPEGGEAGYVMKYYKGLGTSTSSEAKEYFTAITRHQLVFTADVEGEAAIELAFGKAHADARKEWLGGWTRELYLDQSQGSLSYSDFVHRELILFSVASNQRAIPSLLDGLKPGQRKILYSAFLKRLTREIKVAQLAGYVAEKSAYHHGEQALTSTIVGMAQSYVGSNNINLLHPSGMFGTRLAGGKDAASARYIFTNLCPVARAVFPAVDDSILTYLNDDGLDIEPEWYLPVIPMALVNGSSGIGTGWSSSIPNYNPRELIAALRARMRGSPLPTLHPWYRGFSGRIHPCGDGRYQVTGVLQRVDATTLLISELPVGVWTSDYKALLEAMMEAGEVKGYREYHTDTTVAFVVQMTEEQMAAAEGGAGGGLYKKMKLVGSLTTSNMVLFDRDGRLRRYDSAGQIVDEWYGVRLDGYRRRKAEEVRRVGEEVRRLANKARFIVAVVDGTLAIRGVKKAQLLHGLVKAGYDPMPKGKGGKGGKKQEEGEEEGEEGGEAEEGDAGSAVRMGDFEYLLSLPLWSLTLERVEQLKAAKAEKEAEWAELKATSEERMWERDLDALEKALEEHEEEERKREAGEKGKAKGVDGGVKGKGKGKGKEGEGKEPPKGVVIPPPEPTVEGVKEKKVRAVKVKKEGTAAGEEGGEGKGKGRVVKAVAKGRRKKVESEEEAEELAECSDSDVEEVAAPTQPRATRPARAAAVKKNYAEKDDGEDDEDEDGMDTGKRKEQREVDDEDDGEEEYRAPDDDDDFALLTRAPKPVQPAKPAKPTRAAKAVTSPPASRAAKAAVASPPASKASKGAQLASSSLASKPVVAAAPRAKAAQARVAKQTKVEVEKEAKAAGAGEEGLSLSERLALRMQGMGLSDGKEAKPKKALAVKRPLTKAKEGGSGVGLTPEAKKVKAGLKEVAEVKAAAAAAVVDTGRAKRAVKAAKCVAEDSESEEEKEEMEPVSSDDDEWRGGDSDYSE